MIIVWRGSLSALIYLRDKVTWKVLAEYSWNPIITQSGSFLCTAASSTPIRVVTKEVRYIHDLSLTLEHSMPISSPAAPGLTMGSFLRTAASSTPIRVVTKEVRYIHELSLTLEHSMPVSSPGSDKPPSSS